MLLAAVVTVENCRCPMSYVAAARLVLGLDRGSHSTAAPYKIYTG